MKYWHYKVNKTPIDNDASKETVHFDVGKAFHQVLENTMHKKDGIRGQVEKCCTDYNVKQFIPMIHAMVLKYLKVHEASGLECVGCEMELTNLKAIGYVDAVMIDREKMEWWIVDLKTAAFVTDLTFSKLTADVQLNLYASFADKISNFYKLSEYKFAGSRYRVTKKSKLKQKATEEDDDYTKRIYKGIESYDAVIPVALMDPAGFYKKHEASHQLSLELRDGSLAPMVNHSYCDAFFKPCEYFSNCHGGKTFTESVESIEVITTADIK